MAFNGQLQPRILRWTASPSPDVAGYRLYYSQSPDADYTGTYVDVGNSTEVDVATLGLPDGNYYFTAIAYDAVGNLSAGTESGPFTLDLTAPEPAGVVEVVDG